MNTGISVGRNYELNDLNSNWSWTPTPGKELLTYEQWEQVSTALQLSPRESTVCRLLFEGHNRTEIAESMELKFSTVRQYVEKIHAKLRVGTRVALTLRIIQVRDHLAKLDSE